MRCCILCLMLLITFLARITFADERIPGIMVPELTKVTPEMIAKITAACPTEALAKPAKERKILVFSRCENFTHHSITVAHEALKILGEKTKAWSADISYDYAVFDAAKLAGYDAIVLNNCQNMALPDGAPRQALLDFVRNGKGIVAIHSAIDNFGSDEEAELRKMMGGCSAGHPWGHYLAWGFKVEEPKHPLTAHLNPEGFSKKDAIYQFDTGTGRQNVRVLVSLDMTDPTTARDEKGKPRGFRTDGLNPVVWIRKEGKGRVFVNGFGNNDEIFWDASMLKLNLAGIQYAIGDLKADDAPVAGDTNKAPGNSGTPVNTPTQNSEVKPVNEASVADANMIHKDISALPNTRPVTTLTAGKLVTAKVINESEKSHLLLRAATGVLAKGPGNASDTAAAPSTTTRGLKACWWNNNSFTGDPVLSNIVNSFNPILNSPSAPFPVANPPLDPENVSARFTGTFIPKVTGEYKFVSNADDYVALWIDSVEEIAWAGHTAKDRFSNHSFKLVKDVPMDIRLDYRQDKLGYKLTLRLSRQSDGEQIDFGPSVGEFAPTSKAKSPESGTSSNK